VLQRENQDLLEELKKGDTKAEEGAEETSAKIN